MTNSEQQHKVEEAIELIATGVETLESCPVRYGKDWKTIRGQVKVGLLLIETGRIHHSIVQQHFDPERLWQKLYPQIEEIALQKRLSRTQTESGMADSGSAPVEGQPRPGQPLKIFQDTIPLVPVKRRMVDRLSPPRILPHWPGRVAAGLLVALLCSVLFVQIAEASSPGDLLYAPKVNVVERLPEFFAFSDQDRIIAQLSYAEGRLSEIERAISKGKYNQLQETIELYKTTIEKLVDRPSTTELSHQLELQKERVLALESKSALPVQLLANLKVISETVKKVQLPAGNYNQIKVQTPVAPSPASRPEATATAISIGPALFITPAPSTKEGGENQGVKNKGNVVTTPPALPSITLPTDQLTKISLSSTPAPGSYPVTTPVLPVPTSVPDTRLPVIISPSTIIPATATKTKTAEPLSSTNPAVTPTNFPTSTPFTMPSSPNTSPDTSPTSGNDNNPATPQVTTPTPVSNGNPTTPAVTTPAPSSSPGNRGSNTPPPGNGNGNGGNNTPPGNGNGNGGSNTPPGNGNGNGGNNSPPVATTRPGNGNGNGGGNVTAPGQGATPTPKH